MVFCLLNFKKKKKAVLRTSTYKDAGTRNNSTFFLASVIFLNTLLLCYMSAIGEAQALHKHTHTRFFVIVRDAL